MFLPELEVNFLASRFLARALNRPSRIVGTAKVYSDFSPERAFQAIHVRAIENTVAHTAEQALEVWTTEIGARFELSQGILVSTDRVKDNVLRGVDIHFLR